MGVRGLFGAFLGWEKIRRLPKVVVVLGVASLLTDLSSEMIYPLLPLFLTTILAAGPEALGLVEGVAESTAALVKIASGVWSDRVRRRKAFVVSGYTLSGVARPLIGLARVWPAVLLLRFGDRVGKGIRTSPRDAIIASSVDGSTTGTAFGFHRAMDHLGAVLGPLTAAVLLGFLSIRAVFLLAAIPAAAVVVLLVLGVKDRNPPSPLPPKEDRPAGEKLPPSFRVFLAAILVFTQGHSSDTFLLLRFGHVGFGARAILLLWAAHHVVKMIGNWCFGRAADRASRKALLLAGWGIYAAVYVLFGVADSRLLLVLVFLAYGLYFGLAEPVERSWVAALAPKRLRGTAFGLYHMVVGVCALPASVLFGFLWKWGGPMPAFLAGAGLAVAASVLLVATPSPRAARSQGA